MQMRVGGGNSVVYTVHLFRKVGCSIHGHWVNHCRAWARTWIPATRTRSKFQFSPCYQLPSPQYKQHQKTFYVLCRVFVGFCVPLVLIVVFYIVIACYLKQRRSKQKNLRSKQVWNYTYLCRKIRPAKFLSLKRSNDFWHHFQENHVTFSAGMLILT